MPPLRPIRVVDYARRLRVFLGLAVVLFSVAALLVVNWWNVKGYYYAYVQCEEVRRTVEKQKATVAQLEREKHQLKLGGFEIEKAVREADKAVRPGENLIYLRRADNPATSTAEPSIRQNNR